MQFTKKIFSRKQKEIAIVKIFLRILLIKRKCIPIVSQAERNDTMLLTPMFQVRISFTPKLLPETLINFNEFKFLFKRKKYFQVSM